MSFDVQDAPAGWIIEQPFAPLAAAPWANGLGATTELVGYERSRTIRGELAAPDWRLSVAELREPAAFSPLPGVHRNFMPVGGDVVIGVNGVRHEVASGAVLRFSGDAEVTLVALSGSCHAVNLMSPSASLRLRAAAPEQSASVATSAQWAGSLAVAHVVDPATPSTRPLAAVVLPGPRTDADTSATLRFDLYVPSLGTTGAPPFAAAIVVLV